MNNYSLILEKIAKIEQSVTVLGVYNIDVAVTVKKKEELQDAVCKHSLVDFYLGGVGRNVAVALAKLGLKTEFVTSIDTKSIFGSLMLKDLTALKIKTVCLLEESHAFCAVQKAWQFFEGYYSGSNVEKWEGAILAWLESDFKKNTSQILVVESALLNGNRGPEICRKINDLGKKLALIGTAPERIKNILKAQNGIFLLQLNKAEAQKMDFSIENLKKMQEKINFLAVENLLISNAEKGSYFFSKKDCGEVLVKKDNKNEIDDSMGAGDSLFAGTLAGLLAGENLKDATYFGMYCANCTCKTKERVGDFS